MARREFFFVDPRNVVRKDGQAAELLITGEEWRHLARVLRHRPGDCLMAVDGCGTAYAGVLETLENDRARVRVTETLPGYGEPEVHLTLAVGVPRLPRFETLIEKAVEIGVSEIVPMRTEFGVERPGEHKRGRWQRIAMAAMKQCGRSRLPAIHALTPVDRLLTTVSDFDLRCIAHSPVPEGAAVWGEASRAAAVSRILLLVGPEGGFSEKEIARAAECGFAFLPLGKRRLRTETAGIVAAALLLDLIHER